MESIHGTPTHGIIIVDIDHGTGPLWIDVPTRTKVEMQTHNNNSLQKPHWAKTHLTQQRKANIVRHGHSKAVLHATDLKMQENTQPHMSRLSKLQKNKKLRIPT